MKPPVALFKKKCRKVNQKLINAVVRWLHKRTDLKKNIKKEQSKSFLELICFIFYLSFKNSTSQRLCVFILCCLFFIYALLEAVIIKLSKIFEKYLWKYLLLLKLQAVRPLTLLKLTLSQICFKNSAKITTLCFRKCLMNVQLRSCGYASSEKKQIAKLHFPLKNGNNVSNGFVLSIEEIGQ